MRWVLALGVIQGLTEFLPISSSGHLVVLKAWFGVASPGAALEVALHAGTLVAVLWTYRQWLGTFIRKLVQRVPAAWRLFWRLALASIPAGMVGLALDEWVGRFFTVGAVILGWLGTSLLLFATPKPGEGERRMEDMGPAHALLIGLAQAMALWPGLSRSGSTIAMGRVCGLRPEDAARFSFLLAIPTILGASILEAPALVQASIPSVWLIISALLAAVTGAVAIQWVKGIVNRPRLWRGFGLYTALAALAAWFIGG
ncbi:undecaprenyl-diphosphate phosphatase [Sulfobacillus harzensis]|uniref:undecaprenyl-diphosphate phosphatase n=1 Tax=Sulfobacillus harzensis TaxID=2729629 RepID=UPI001FADAA19|nr:undecaprenyl-diphosphate phosphatase [Sulfobacillus harzensis]